MKKLLAMLLAMVMVLSMVACGTTKTETPATTAAPAAPAATEAGTATEAPETEAPAAPLTGEVNVYTTWDDTLTGCLLEEMAEVHPGVTVNIIKMNGGEMMTRIEAEASNPQADFIMGAGCEGYINLADKGLLLPYQSPNAEGYADFNHDADWNWYAFNNSYLGFYCDTEWFESQGMELPDSWEDLLDPRLEDQIVITNPGTSTTGYMVLSTLVQLMGEEEGLAYYEKLDKNVKTYASGGSGPSQSVALGEAPVGIGYMQHGMLLIQEGYTNMTITAPSEGTGTEITGSAIIKGCKNLDNAKALADVICSKSLAERCAEATTGMIFASGVLGKGLENFSDIALVDLDYVWAAENKDRLIGEWDKLTANS